VYGALESDGALEVIVTLLLLLLLAVFEMGGGNYRKLPKARADSYRKVGPTDNEN